jgi:multiple sugar transport system substrate-binding protein
MNFRKNWTRAAALTLTAGIVAATITSGGISRAQDQALTIWTKYNDQNPQVTSDQWMADIVADYQAEQGITLENTFVVYNEINTRLNVAVQAGGDLPDVSYVDSQNLGFYINNGTLTDLTERVQNASWYADLNPGALAACTAPDGRIYCVPATTSNYFIYYWTDAYPDGFPATTDELLAAAPTLNEDGLYAITFKGAEGASVERFYWPLIHSFGGEVVDAEGRATWANEATVRAVEFVRELYQNGYAPEVVLAPAFDFEEPFKQGEAGAFVAGTFSYVYLTPLTAPDDTVFEAAPPESGFDTNAIAVGDAFDAGKLAFAPPLSAPGGEPVSIVTASSWGIPEGSANSEGAWAFIDWVMSYDNVLSYAVAGGQLPTLRSVLEDEVFSGAYWQESAKYLELAGVAAPGWTNYDDALRLLSTAIVNSITDPSRDIMAELQAAQDEYNLGLE